MTLVDIADNPIPANATSGFIYALDGVKLRYASWSATAPLQGTVTLLQGRSEFIEKYFETISDLRNMGFNVVTFDWRGQGGSQRLLRAPLRGHVDDFAEYLWDLDAILTQVSLANFAGPHFALAHSMGGAVLLFGHERLRTRFDRAVLLSPMIALADTKGMPSGMVAPIAGALTGLGFGKALIPFGRGELQPSFAGNPLTSAPHRFDRMNAVVSAAPYLCVGAPTIGWIDAACRVMKSFFAPGFGPALKLPVLVVASGADKVVSTRRAEAFCLLTRSANFLEIAGARHELLMEDERFREQALAAFSAFVPGETILEPA